MGGMKETYEVSLNPDHMAFLRSAREKYGINGEDKALRIVLDYLITSPAIHDTVFSEARCLRCE